jgi:hypothetical protein
MISSLEAAAVTLKRDDFFFKKLPLSLFEE